MGTVSRAMSHDSLALHLTGHHDSQGNGQTVSARMLPESVSPWTGVTIVTDEAGQSLVTLSAPWWNIRRNSGSCCKFPKKVWKQRPSIALQNSARAQFS